MLSDIRRGAQVDLLVEKLAFGGNAIAHVDGFVVFLRHAVPGQKVRAVITKKKKQYAEGKVLEVLSQSPAYVEPFCPHFGVCGGCRWQDIPYEDQLYWKRLHVSESLQHLAGVGESLVAPAVPSPSDKWYRNKMEFTFAARRWLSDEEIACRDIQYDRSFTLGLHVRGFFDKVFNVEHCFLESPESVEILKVARDWCAASGLPPYSTREHSGFWRFFIIREGKRTGQKLVHLLTTTQGGTNERMVDGLAGHLRRQFPSLTTFVHSISDKKAQVALSERTRTVYGPGYIEEILGGLRFRISANSFFQTNSIGAERLYETVRRFGEFRGTETVWDLYCGTGSIALFIASHVRNVVGFEVVQDAVSDAYINCELNGVGNCRFVAGDLKDMITDSLHSGDKPEVIVTDPPRAGMHPDVVKALREISPRRIIAVSCNPATLARDVSLLLDRYDVRNVQPFDLFPYTPHIECVVRLDRKV